jgi:hypothetical protein
MKLKLYSTSWAKLGKKDEQLSSDDYAKFCQDNFGKYFETKESLLDWYLKTDSAKLTALDFLKKHISEKGCHSVISFGAGPCVLEHLLKKKLPNLKVIATDYNPFYVDNAKRLFPELEVRKYDFFKDDISDLEKEGVSADLAVFFGSTYVMDDELFIKQLGDLHKIGITEAIDFHAGYLPLRKLPRTLLSQAFRKISFKLNLNLMKGKFHGYCRTRGELKRLYKNAGFTRIIETSLGLYEYVAICSSFSKAVSD